MSRRNPKRRMTGKHFAQIPVEVLTSDACRTLPHSAVRVLIALCAQFRGRNNGDLSLTWRIVQLYGVRRKAHLVKGLGLLLERGLIVKTRQGGKRPLGPSLYAITWQPIDECNGKLEVQWSMTASDAWARWATGPALEPEENKSTGPPSEPDSQFNGTAGGPPSRSRREDPRPQGIPHAVKAH